MKSKRGFYPYAVWMAIFVIVPLGMILYYSFTNAGGSFTFDNFIRIFTSKKPDYMGILLTSLRIALISTLICLVLAYPFAYIMSRMTEKRQRTMNLLIMLPMWMNFLLRIYAWMMLLEENGLINRLFGLIGFGPIQMINTEGAVIIGMVYNFLPFMVLPIYSVMAKIEQNLIEASQDLGGNMLQTFRRVILPLSLPGVITGITMVFVPAASTFVISQSLGNMMMIGDTIEMFFVGTSQNFNIGSALSLILMVIILISMAIMNHFDKDEDGGNLI
ncbi:MAG: ABC transporter permease [Ruminococcaceae bacterium]|nr:ABC transporter permease [Oscillospiraceae bacterium]